MPNNVCSSLEKNLNSELCIFWAAEVTWRRSHSTSNSIGRGRKLGTLCDLSLQASHLICPMLFNQSALLFDYVVLKRGTSMHCRKQERLTDPIDGRRFCGIGKRKRHFAMSIADSDWNPSPDQPACLIHFGCFYKHLHLSAFCVSQVSLGQDAWQIEAEWIHLECPKPPKRHWKAAGVSTRTRDSRP